MRLTFFYIFIFILIIFACTTGQSPEQPLKNNIKSRNINDIEFIFIRGGEFLMGAEDNEFMDETPKHKVYVSSFWMSKYEITQKQYQRLTGNNPSKFKNDNNPVEIVTWLEAVKFCEKFSRKYNIKVRLPYEAEWEYACRAGSTTRYYWGKEMDGKYCWYDKNAGKKTHPVGEKEPNQWGLYDMSGNVWEWCMDWHDEAYYSESPLKDPKGPLNGKYKVQRGGSWHYDYSFQTATYRDREKEDKNCTDLGFRIVALSLDQ